MKRIVLALINLYRNGLRFRGRLSRAGYWWAVLGYIIIALCLAFIPNRLFYDIFGLVSVIPFISASVRRYHDTGRSGKQVAAIVFVTMASTVVNIVVAIVFLNGLALSALSVYNGGGLNEIQGPSGHFLLFIVAIVNVFIILGVCIYNIVILSLPSQPGTNVYGEWIPFGAKAVRDCR